MTTHGVAAYPLYWPLHHPRAERRRDAAFRVDFATARSQLLRELDLLFARDIIVSSNVPIRRDGLPAVPDREPEDPGVAVYFTRAGRPFVIACDQFTRIRWNLRAVGATIEALRSIERHGTTSMLEQAFSGFAALPARSEPAKAWHEVLGVVPHAPTATIRAAYRELARKHHPDVGGDPARMGELNAAYRAAMTERSETP
jgi:hypothetical protein